MFSVAMALPSPWLPGHL